MLKLHVYEATPHARNFVLIVFHRYSNSMYNWRSNPADLDNTDYHFDCCCCNKEKTGGNQRESGDHTIRVSVHLIIYKNNVALCSIDPLLAM